MACISNPGNLGAELPNDFGTVPVGGSSLSKGGWIMLPLVIQHRERNLTKYWGLSEAEQQAEIPSHAKLASIR